MLPYRFCAQNWGGIWCTEYGFLLQHMHSARRDENLFIHGMKVTPWAELKRGEDGAAHVIDAYQLGSG